MRRQRPYILLHPSKLPVFQRMNDALRHEEEATRLPEGWVTVDAPWTKDDQPDPMLVA